MEDRLLLLVCMILAVAAQLCRGFSVRLRWYEGSTRLQKEREAPGQRSVSWPQRTSSWLFHKHHAGFQGRSERSGCLLMAGAGPQVDQTEDVRPISATAPASAYAAHRMHPSLFGKEFREEWADPRFLSLVEHFRGKQETSDSSFTEPLFSHSGSAGSMPHFLEGLPLSEWDMKVEMRNVYSFPCFHPQFMSMINEEIQNFQEVAEKLSISYRKPNTMNNFGVILNDIGMKDVLSDFQRRFILPLSRCLYPEEGEYLHDHHSFIVQYCAEGDKGLGMHKDDSEVTLNVCLGHDFTGALLRFGRTSLVPSIRDQPLLLYQHEVGRGLLHLGNQLHGAEDIASGERVNLIIWSKNNKWRNF